MRNKYIICGFILIILMLIPVPLKLKDGGSIEHKAILYKYTKIHRITNNGYECGWKLEILGLKISEEISMCSIDDSSKKITWDEITSNGVNEQMLVENIDTEILKEIAAELQTLVEEETEEERRNPEIVITEGWGRVFSSERYKKVISIGEPAMKPLYLIIYKSANAGAYEYICAKALYDISGYDFEWVNSKDFLEKFNEQVISEIK